MDRNGDNLMWNKNILRGLIVLTILVANTGVSAKSLRADHCQMVWDDLTSTINSLVHSDEILSAEYRKPVHQRMSRSNLDELEEAITNWKSAGANLSTIWANACKDHH